MEENNKSASEMPQEESGNNAPEKGKKVKKHLIHPTWLRRTLKSLLGVVLFVIILPFLLYIPPIQDLVVHIAEKEIKKSTGMDVSIDHFRLKFPLDLSIEGLSVVEANGDTLVSASEVLAKVKLLPLLKLDVDVDKLELQDAYYRLVSPDSSMIMSIRAAYLQVDDQSSVDIRKSDINLNKAVIHDADIQMFTDVWRQKPTPVDTTSTPFTIRIGDLQGQRIRFGMSLLPTIDTLAVYADNLQLKNGLIDLGASRITADELIADGGDVTFLTPTEEYIKSHPAPVDSLAVESPPMVIEGKKVDFKKFNVLYGIAGAKPQPGFDASYLQLTDVDLDVNNFYNAASTLRVPIQSLSGKERCGLHITEGNGLVAIDSTGIYLDSLKVATPYSKIDVTAGLPFALMEMHPGAPVDINLKASLGMHDIAAFMPSLNEYTRFFNSTQPVNLNIDAHGNLDDVDVPRLDVAVPGVVSLRAFGYARDPMNIKKAVASLNIDGELSDPSVVKHFTGDLGFDVPRLKIKGTAGADHNRYSANLALLSPQGDIAAKGKVNLNSEAYNVHVDVKDFNAAYFVPDAGVGMATLSLDAKGDGFNPESPRASTDIKLTINSIEYNHTVLRDILLTATLGNHEYEIDLNSPNRDAQINMALAGTIYPDNYSAKGYLHCYRLDLKELVLDTAMNGGAFDVYIDGTASPAKWLYDLDLTINNLDWDLPGQAIHLPKGIEAKLLADEDSVVLDLDCQNTSLAFTSPQNLKTVVEDFSSAAKMAAAQIDRRELMTDSIQHALPRFNLRINSPGKGLLDQMLASSDISLDSVSVALSNDTIISGNASLLGLQTKSMTLDTISLNLNQRNYLLDYKIHIGNQPGTMDELANVNLSGYVGGNRLSAYLNQRNLKGETGYKIGLTAAINDSTATVHFTPLNAMIGYRPWTLNADNFIDVNLINYKIEANLEAKSNESAILVETRASADDLQELHLKLTDIHIEDFLQMSVGGPSIAATVNSDIRARYDGKELVGIGRLGVTDFVYDKMKVDDLNLSFQASMGLDGAYDVTVGLAVDHQKAMLLSSKLQTTSEGLEPEFVTLKLDHFPLSVANPFLGNDVASLKGSVSGEMDLSGGFTQPILNGSLTCDSVAVYLPIMGSSLKFDNEPLTVTDNVIRFNKFDIWGANSNPLTIDGTIDATHLTDIQLDIEANANNFQLIGNDRRAGSDIYGKLFLNLSASAKGPMTHFTAIANLNVLGNTDVTYAIPDANTAIQGEKNNDVVRFVNLSDTTTFQPKEQESVFMRVQAAVSITPGTQVSVLLSNNGTDKVQLTPSGTVNLYRNYMGDITLNGQLTLGNGFARYNIPVIGEKEFVFDPSSYVAWNGPMMNPLLHIKATDTMKVSVSQNGGNSRLVNFLIKLTISGSLSSPGLLFDLATDDDMTIQNQLQGMSADQRNSAAMNMLITGQYSAGDISTNAGPLTGNVYNFLTQQLNSWAAKNIRGVDLSFGVNQYDMTNNGQSSTATSYSYQLSKSLFNNRFKISVGGNYSTNDSPDDNLTQNLISDISFEYIIRQSQTQTMLVKLFRHNGYESILEGEIIEMGAGFVYKRKLGDFKSFFRSGHRRKKSNDTQSTVIPDSLQKSEVSDTTNLQ